MKIVWHGHSCFEISDKLTVAIDPHDGKSLGLRTPVLKADVVLISHDHFDHNSARTVKGDFAIVREPGERTVKGLKISGLEANHDEMNGSKRGRIVIFSFTLDGVRFCHCGDLGELLDQSQISALGPVDVLFVPVGGVFTIDGPQALQLISMVKPKIAIPMHFRVGGLSLSIQTIDRFLEGIPESKVLHVGNSAEFEKDDLPESTEYWVFSP
ncbi:MAG: MBL fold metallo-hydrolase [Methanomassiliicoccales archaeon]|nr:MBL fold metallo-hydrolase [Methanomassiliicoccales archaeon]